MLLRSIETLDGLKNRMEDLDIDLEQIRYDLSSIQKELIRKKEERKSIEEQLELTDYNDIKERLDECVTWLRRYPEKLQENVRRKTQMQDEINQLTAKLEDDKKKIKEYQEKREYLLKCYEAEYRLKYVKFPEESPGDAKFVRDYLETEGKALNKDTIINNLNSVYFENRGFLVDYQLMQNELFEDL